MFLGDYHSLAGGRPDGVPLFARSFGPSTQIALACARTRIWCRGPPARPGHATLAAHGRYPLIRPPKAWPCVASTARSRTRPAINADELGEDGHPGMQQPGGLARSLPALDRRSACGSWRRR